MTQSPQIIIRAALLLCAISYIAEAQPPAITQEGVRNAASQMPPSVPGGALAPGGRFIIQGLRLAAPNSETHVSIRRGEGSVEAQVISADAERIDALVPAQTPAGNSQLVVTLNGQSSRPFAMRVAPSAFGIFSRNGRGWGPGEIWNDGKTPNTRTSPAQPGSVATLSGTGMGTARSVEILAGGKRARALGRQPVSGRPGVEEIRFQLAADTPEGCFVPLLVKLPAGVSNVVTLSIAAKGQPCQGVAPGTALILLTRLSMHAKLTFGIPVEFRQDIGSAIFPPEDGSDAALTTQEMLPPTGTCSAFTGRLLSDSLVAIASEFPPFFGGAGRNAGPAITISGPAGESTLQPSPQLKAVYANTLGGGPPVRPRKPPFLEPGKYRISGAGGPDVGEFSAEAVYQPGLEWTRPDRLDTIDRARGATVKWTGVGVKELVLLVAASVDPLSGGTGVCVCLAPGSAGRWRLPSLLLSNLPPSRPTQVPRSYVLVATLPVEHAPFSARGLKGGIVVFTTVRGRTVQFK